MNPGTYTVTISESSKVTVSEPQIASSQSQSPLVGDGVTDVTDALQAALIAGDVFLPYGTYRIVQKVDSSSNPAITIPADRQLGWSSGSGHGTIPDDPG